VRGVGGRFTDGDLYNRMAANLLASWTRYADGSTGASVIRIPAAAMGVFPEGPERSVYNNALLSRDLGPSEAAQAVMQIAEVYADAGVDRYAVWAHESEVAALDELRRGGFRVDTRTRAMAVSLDEISPPRPEIELGPSDWSEHRRYLLAAGVPEGLLAGVDGDAFQVLTARLDGRMVATAIAYDHNGDCGIYNMGTLPHARRRGLGSALTMLHVRQARERGCVTASLQASEMAERVYAAVGFRDLGRFIEYVPRDSGPGERG
jgi:ribosomal protein S18 acetylase RimI-like enzyme